MSTTECGRAPPSTSPGLCPLHLPLRKQILGPFPGCMILPGKTPRVEIVCEDVWVFPVPPHHLGSARPSLHPFILLPAPAVSALESPTNSQWHILGHCPLPYHGQRLLWTPIA